MNEDMQEDYTLQCTGKKGKKDKKTILYLLYMQQMYRVVFFLMIELPT